ncbi:MAG: outer membrane protein assembly factor [Candidatus Sumerlaeota bacterium]|nr:outer membrane protein assembly factor [Candidatus Sumerlaeota bacterium]
MTSRKPFLFAFFIAVMLAGRTPVFATPNDTLTAIEFQGGDAISRSRLEAAIKSRVGEPYDAQVVQDDLKSLSELARNVEARRAPYQNGVKLIFVLVPYPKVRDIAIVGNSKLTTKRLLATIPVKKGETLEADSIAKTREKILEDYRGAGLTKTSARIETIENDDGTVNLQVFIDEGERLKIKDVKIEGAKSLSNFRLRWDMDNKGSWLFFKNYFDEATFKEDLQKITRMYLSYGYFSVDVHPGEFIYDQDKKEVTPVIVVNEGPRFTIRNVKVDGATYFGPAEVQAPFAKLAGKPFDADDVAAAIEKVQSLYYDEGFLMTLISEDYQLDKPAAALDLVVNVKERQRVRVGKVIIDRNPYPTDQEMGFFTRFYSKIAPPVKDEAIKEEVLLKPGDVYSKEKERETVERLDRLGIFDSVKAHSEPTGDESVRDMVLTVEEGVTGNVIFGVGYGDESGIYGFGSYTERNLFGEARDLRANVLVGQRTTAANIGYFDRHWGANGESLAVDLFKEDFTRRGYDESQAGARAEIGKPLDEYLTAYFRARVGYVWLDETEDGLSEEMNNYGVAAGRIRLVQDSRDSQVWPTKGLYRAGGVEAGYAGGPLVNATGQYQIYKTLKDSWIYALNTEAGLSPFKAEQYGITERFFLGGTDDLRGFAFRGAGPMDGKDHDVSVGGSTKLLIQNELRYTILDNLGLGQGKTPLNGLVFADMGMLGRDPLQVGTPRASVGTGFRVDMRHVNVGVDLAAPVLKQDTDRTQWFHFKVGSKF